MDSRPADVYDGDSDFPASGAPLPLLTLIRCPLVTALAATALGCAPVAPHDPARSESVRNVILMIGDAWGRSRSVCSSTTHGGRPTPATAAGRQPSNGR